MAGSARSRLAGGVESRELGRESPESVERASGETSILVGLLVAALSKISRPRVLATTTR